MAEASGLNRRFEDIEMLEVPDDDDEQEGNYSTSSETEGILSDSSDSTKDEIDASASQSQDQKDANMSSNSNITISAFFTGKNDYPDLSQWLNSKQLLHYQYDQKRYLSSVNKESEIDQNYISYLNNNYKVVEQLITNIQSIEDEDQFTQPIGLITNSNTTAEKTKINCINQSFHSILENLRNLNRQDKSIVSDDKNQFLLMILSCLQSSEFYTDMKGIPELIIEWVNMFDPEPSVELIDEIMINHPSSYTHPSFWNTLVSKMVCRGLFQQVDETLEHSNYYELEEKNITLFEVINDLRQLLADYSTFALKGQFPQWKLSACEFRDSIAFSKQQIGDDEDSSNYQIMLSQIYDIACIMTGFSKTITNYCDSWYEVYLAFSLYQIRDNKEIYQDFFQKAITEKPPTPQILTEGQDKNYDDLTESCFINILEKKYVKVLETLFTFDPATTAYISLLLEFKGVLNNYYFDHINVSDNITDLFNKKTISEYFLLRHAYDCLNIQSLVPIGIGLLSNEILNTSTKKMERNKSTIAQFLPHYKLQSNDDLEWALTICADLALVSTARNIYYQAGIQALEDGYLYDALNDFVNCYDPEKVSGNYHKEGIQKIHYIIWDIIFTDCLVNNKPIQDELINDIVDQKMEVNIHPIIQQCISPYAVLKEFYNSLANNESTNEMLNFSRVIHLLKFEYLPKKFKPLLLSQLLLFLNDVSPLKLPDLITIIEMIDNYENESTQEEKDEGEQIYAYSTTNIDESNLDAYDWRKVVEELPKDVESLLKFLRNKVTVKISKAFIEK
ncbi:NUP85 [Candida jiufengensis]|uniref:NUP85 n=1 Tax=Candida jiufengensis TaxID=497108 RepID=UPI002224F178|nr:NUP85 [Candida jiufengensis]KAI5952843.1 NUP85 [Candida jiufengensis]